MDATLSPTSVPWLVIVSTFICTLAAWWWWASRRVHAEPRSNSTTPDPPRNLNAREAFLRQQEEAIRRAGAERAKAAAVARPVLVTSESDDLDSRSEQPPVPIAIAPQHAPAPALSAPASLADATVASPDLSIDSCRALTAREAHERLKEEAARRQAAAAAKTNAEAGSARATQPSSLNVSRVEQGRVSDARARVTALTAASQSTADDPVNTTGAPVPDTVPEHRVLSRDARYRFGAIDPADPHFAPLPAEYGAEMTAALRYNKTRADRVCQVCSTQYLPLPEGTPAEHPAWERIEGERRLSGICSLACWRRTGVPIEAMGPRGTAPGRAAAAASAVPPPPPPLIPGSVVLVRGLSSRPDLEGRLAVVQGDVSAAGGIAVAILCGSGSPVAITVQPALLAPLPLPTEEAAAERWELRLPRMRGRVSLADLISESTLGDIDACHDFVASLMAAVRPRGMPPRRLFSRAAIPGILRTPGHTVYACSFDAVGHHFVLDVLDGYGRLYQSYVQTEVTYGPGMPSDVTGYNAREWVDPEPAEEWEAEQPALLAAHARWGGGRVLPPSELCALLLAYAELQELGDAAVAELTPQLPAALRVADEAITERNELAVAVAMTTGARRIELERSPLDEWTAAFMDGPSTLSHLRLAGGGMRVHTNGAYAGQHPCHLAVSAQTASRLAAAWEGLTGQGFTGVQYMSLLHFRHWRVYEAQGGMAKAAGGTAWGITETIPWE